MNQRRLLLAIGGIILFVLVSLLTIFALRGRQEDSPPTSTLYLMDSSARMSAPFGSGQITMFTAAATFVRDTVSRSPNTNVIGLRVFGSGSSEQECQDTELIVPPLPGSQSEITASLNEISTVSKEAALVAGAVAAIRDLAALDYGGRLRLVIITGGSGTCLDQSQELIIREANREQIELDTIIINIGPDQQDVLALRSLAEELGNAVVLDATSEESLQEIGQAIESGGIEVITTVPGPLPTVQGSSVTNTPFSTPIPPTAVSPTELPTETASPAPTQTDEPVPATPVPSSTASSTPIPPSTAPPAPPQNRHTSTTRHA